MKTLNQYIQEQLIINKNYRDAGLSPKSFDELRKIIEDRYKKLGPGTKQDPIDFNDIDVSNIDSFYDKYNGGIFGLTKFKYIDISAWDVSNAVSIRNMFYGCKELKSVGNISGWDIFSVTDMSYMFAFCKKLKSVVDLSKWDVSSVTDMSYMFLDCTSFNQNISSWDVSSVTDMSCMFCNCLYFNQDISNWNMSKVMYRVAMFEGCPIKDEYKPKFK